MVTRRCHCNGEVAGPPELRPYRICVVIPANMLV
ncbi:hypothetical protein NOCA2100033 [metagenome]|uniref:Uncharacterized protein n=1 Tax=metagenome TaxID=256318 RepID=A0A2P2BVY9_9ZZZZ